VHNLTQGLNRWWLAAAALAALLTACSKNETPPPAADAAPAAPSTPAAPVEGAPQIVTSADGVHIEYHVYGQVKDKSGPAIVLIHGWACDGNYWSAQLADLKAKYTTVTVDLAGHGASGRNRTDWSMGNFGEDVAAVVRVLQNPKIILVGHSMGAPVALEATRRIGDRVIGIIAVDSLKTIGQPPPTDAQIQLRLKPFRDDFIGHTREYVTSAMFATGADPKFVQKVAYDMSLEPPEVGLGAMEGLSRMDYAQVLPEIHVPVIAINSSLGKPADEARIRKSIPTFKAIRLENTGHFMMMEAPERFNPVLLQQIAALAK
jgi:pimeloyl-ACP methyl ester carboxylesterase